MVADAEIRRLRLAKADDPYIFLADLELWVQDWLDDWLIMNLESPHSSTCLSELIEGYTTAASSHYAESPEDVSLMLLTAIELWVALDKCSIHQHSLLSKYDPGFPQSLFHPLLCCLRSRRWSGWRVSSSMSQGE